MGMRLLGRADMAEIVWQRTCLMADLVTVIVGFWDYSLYNVTCFERAAFSFAYFGVLVGRDTHHLFAPRVSHFVVKLNGCGNGGHGRNFTRWSQLRRRAGARCSCEVYRFLFGRNEITSWLRVVYDRFLATLRTNLTSPTLRAPLRVIDACVDLPPTRWRCARWVCAPPLLRCAAAAGRESLSGLNCCTLCALLLAVGRW